MGCVPRLAEQRSLVFIDSLKALQIHRDSSNARGQKTEIAPALPPNENNSTLA
jgi:AAA+ superfamily predicted ATPase